MVFLTSTICSKNTKGIIITMQVRPHQTCSIDTECADGLLYMSWISMILIFKSLSFVQCFVSTSAEPSVSSIVDSNNGSRSVHIHMHTARTQAHAHRHMHTDMHTHMLAHTQAHAHTHACTHTGTCTQTCTHTCLHTHRHMHTDMHTHMLAHSIEILHSVGRC